MLAQLVQRVLDPPLGDAVERVRRFVENEDRRIADDRASQGDPLLLAARQPYPSRAEHRVVLRWQPFDEIVGVGLPGRIHDFVVSCIEPAVGDVVPHGRVEEVHVLTDQRELAAPRREIEFGKRTAVKKDRAVGRVHEAKNQFDNRGFPATRQSDQGGGLARSNGEGRVGQGGVVRLVVAE